MYLRGGHTTRNTLTKINPIRNTAAEMRLSVFGRIIYQRVSLFIRSVVQPWNERLKSLGGITFTCSYFVVVGLHVLRLWTCINKVRQTAIRLSGPLKYQPGHHLRQRGDSITICPCSEVSPGAACVISCVASVRLVK